MKPEIVAEYLSKLKAKTGLTYEAIAEKSQISESSVKNLCLGKSGDPQMSTIAPVVYALGGSLDEMLNPEKSRDDMKETSVIALKDSYDFQAALLKEANEQHINNIRSHYEQHHNDLRDNYEMRLADKREMIELLKAENAELKSQLAQKDDKKEFIELLQSEIVDLKQQLVQKDRDTRIGNFIRNCIIGLFVIGTIILLVLEFMHPAHGWIRFSHNDTPIGFFIGAIIFIIVIVSSPTLAKIIKKK